MIGDVSKELPEDAWLLDHLDSKIPALSKEPERSFDFVVSEVRSSVICPLTRQMRLWETFENTVFKTWAMPHMSPPRQLCMNITEMKGARPVAQRHYPVVPQHMAKLEWQIQALIDAGDGGHECSLS